MTDTSITNYTVKVRKDQSLTSILKEMIEKMKNKNPDVFLFLMTKSLIKSGLM